MQTFPVAEGLQSVGQVGGARAYLPSTVLTSDGSKGELVRVLQTVPIAAGLDGLARVTMTGGVGGVCWVVAIGV